MIASVYIDILILGEQVISNNLNMWENKERKLPLIDNYN